LGVKRQTTAEMVGKKEQQDNKFQEPKEMQTTNWQTKSAFRKSKRPKRATNMQPQQTSSKATPTMCVCVGRCVCVGTCASVCVRVASEINAWNAHN